MKHTSYQAFWVYLFFFFLTSGPYLRFEEEVAVLQHEVNKLSSLGVNKIIALGHSGFDTDKEIARKVRGVDVVIGGHTNTFLYTGTYWDSFQISSGSLNLTQSLAVWMFLQENAVVCVFCKSWYHFKTNPIKSDPDYESMIRQWEWDGVQDLICLLINLCGFFCKALCSPGFTDEHCAMTWTAEVHVFVLTFIRGKI